MHLPGACLSFPSMKASSGHTSHSQVLRSLGDKEDEEPRTAAAAEGEALQHQDTSYWKWFQNMLNLPTISGTEALPSLPTTSLAAVTGPINFILDVENWNLGRKRGKQRHTLHTANAKEIPPLASQQLQREHDRGTGTNAPLSEGQHRSPDQRELQWLAPRLSLALEG